MTGGQRDSGRAPRDRGIDATLSMAVEGSEFISRRCRRHRSDVVETRLLLQRTICMRGADAARLFYDTERFQRSGAMPAQDLNISRGHIAALPHSGTVVSNVRPTG